MEELSGLRGSGFRSRRAPRRRQPLDWHGGTSPFGANGVHPSGLRVGPKGGGRSALGVADARAYKPYRSDLVLDVRQSKSRCEAPCLSPRGCARRARPRRDHWKDRQERRGARNRPSPTPPASRARPSLDGRRRLDGSARAPCLAPLLRGQARFEHPGPFDVLLPQLRLRPPVRHRAFPDPVRVRDVLDQHGQRPKLVVVGDAAMHPGELLGAGDLANANDPHAEARRCPACAG